MQRGARKNGRAGADGCARIPISDELKKAGLPGGGRFEAIPYLVAFQYNLLYK